MRNFSKREALKAGWTIFKANWPLLLSITVISLVVNTVSPLVIRRLPESLTFFKIVLYVLYMVSNIIISLGMMRIYLLLVDGQPAKISDIFSVNYLFWPYIRAYILLMMLVFVSFFPALMVIAAINVFTGVLRPLVLVLAITAIGLAVVSISVKLQFWPWILVDEHIGGRQSLLKSWEITSGVTLNLILFGLVLGLINLLGLLFFMVGSLITTPVTQLALTCVYRQLKGENWQS